MPHPLRQFPAIPDASDEAAAMALDAAVDVHTPPVPLRVRMTDSFAEAEPAWRQLERHAVLTPYQRYDWLQPLLAARGGKERLAIAIIEADEAPVALLPLALTSRLGLSVARLLGDDAGNTGWMIIDPAAATRFDRTTLAALFTEIAVATGGIDAVALHNLPASREGLDNPLLAFPHQPAPDHLYAAPLDASRPNSKRRRNILRGKRRLEETMGPVSLRRADTVEAIAEMHAVFLAQRNARFARTGVPNVFAAPWFVAFFRDTAQRALGCDRPALRLHALYAGDEIVATSCGTYGRTHYSQFINSAADGQAAKSSLMGLLMLELTDELQAEGITSIDMGLGDFAYKTDWTDREVVYDTIVPLTARGRLAAPLLRGMRRLKRAIKQNERLFGLLKQLRAMTLRSRYADTQAGKVDSGYGR